MKDFNENKMEQQKNKSWGAIILFGLLAIMQMISFIGSLTTHINNAWLPINFAYIVCSILCAAIVVIIFKQKLKQKNRLVLSKKFLIISSVLLFIYMYANIPSLSFSNIIKGLIYVVLLLLIRRHIEVLLIPITYSVIHSCFSPIAITNITNFSVIFILGFVIKMGFCTIWILSLYKDITPKITKAATLAYSAWGVFSLFLDGVGNIWGLLASLVFIVAIWLIFFFATKEENNEPLATATDFKILLAIIGLVAVVLVLIQLFTDETITYYIDYNGNGKEDWGEAQFYEDKDGTHWLN